MRIIVSGSDDPEEVLEIDEKHRKVITLFRGHLKNEYDMDDVVFLPEEGKDGEKQ